MSWFSKIAGDVVKTFESTDKGDKNILGVFKDVKNSLERTMNDAGNTSHIDGAAAAADHDMDSSSSNHHKSSSSSSSSHAVTEVNLDREEEAGAPWALSQPSLRGREGELKELILQITLGDEKDVIERLKTPPPPEVDFEFDFERETAKALGCLNVDKRLQRMRFVMVPKMIKEDVFWRNYFFQVDQIRRAFLLGIKVLARPAPSEEVKQQQRQQREIDRYADESDNLDGGGGGGGGEFASDDIDHVFSDESLRAHVSLTSAPSSGATSTSSPSLLGTGSGLDSKDEGAEDWELEMRRELEFDENIGLSSSSSSSTSNNNNNNNNAPHATSASSSDPSVSASLAALQEEIEKEFNFDD